MRSRRSTADLVRAGRESIVGRYSDHKWTRTALGRLAGYAPGMSEREESDQLPEEGPEQQVPDDEPGDARDQADENPGVQGEDTGQDTGNPGAAG
jgi:hypothetical protein